MCHYFISYNWSNKNGQTGSGCTIVERKEKITSRTNLSDLHNELVEMLENIDNIVILNFILLDK